MKEIKEIQEEILKCKRKVFEESTRYSQREALVARVHALEWVLMDEKDILKDRLVEIDKNGRDGKSNRAEADSE